MSSLYRQPHSTPDIYDDVQRSWYQTGYLKIHGWVFDVKTGRLIDLGLNMEEEFREIRSIYDLKPINNP